MASYKIGVSALDLNIAASKAIDFINRDINEKVDLFNEYVRTSKRKLIKHRLVFAFADVLEEVIKIGSYYDLTIDDITDAVVVKIKNRFS